MSLGLGFLKWDSQLSRDVEKAIGYIESKAQSKCSDSRYKFRVTDAITISCREYIKENLGLREAIIPTLIKSIYEPLRFI